MSTFVDEKVILYLFLKEGENVEKLSALYQMGKEAKIKEVLEEKLGIRIDHTITLDFYGLEKIIDCLGGVSVYITQEEADYLNHTNFISKKENRNLSSGTQLLNGNQALGYARIRKAADKAGHLEGFGRGERNLTILKSILEQYKNLDTKALFAAASSCISYITTDMSSKEVLSLIQDTDISSINVKTQQIPESERDCFMTRINGFSVIEYDFSGSKSMKELKTE